MKKDKEAEQFRKNCGKAAKALEEADVLLLVTGAGFSADSGLAVYEDVAKVPAYQQRELDYSDICQPHWLERDPELFYGFWGQCYNDYRTTKLHDGYSILAQWKDVKNKSDVARDIQSRILEKNTPSAFFDDEETLRLTPYLVEEDQAPGAFYSFTSNVDGHFYDAFDAHEIHDCHGNVELWQCSDSDCGSGIWRAPLKHKFVIDPNTMLAPEHATELPVDCNRDISTSTDASTSDDAASSSLENIATPRVGRINANGVRSDPLRGMPPGVDTKGWRQQKSGYNWPRCGHCDSLARPAILMFGDYDWKCDMSQYKRWELWRKTVLDLLLESTVLQNICILEIGCGVNVPTCRFTSEQMVEDVVCRGGTANLIRINPDFPDAPEGSISAQHLIPIQSKGLVAIKMIDKLYKPLSE